MWAEVLLLFALGAGSDESRLLEQANAHYRALESEQAVRLYREYLRRHSDRPDVRIYLGGALLNLRRLDEALAEARQALALNSRYAKAYVLSGRIYAEMQDWTAAGELFEAAVEIDPRDPDAWYFLGRTRFDAGQFEGAIDALRQAARHGPRQSRTYEKLGLACEAMGRFPEAQAAFRKAVELAPDSYQPHLVYGAFLYKQSRIPESLNLLDRAFALQPTSIDVRFELARVLYQFGNSEKALAVLAPARSTRQCRVFNLLTRIRARLGDEQGAQNEIAQMNDCVAN